MSTISIGWWPKESILVTGLKREIDLLSRIKAKAGDEITVLDISMDKNREALDRVLEAGASVFYADHHYSGDIPEHENLSGVSSASRFLSNEMQMLGGKPSSSTVPFDPPAKESDESKQRETAPVDDGFDDIPF